MTKKHIRKGVYLVIDPSMDRSVVTHKLQQALKGSVVAVQIWDNFRQDEDIKSLITTILDLCHPHDIPVLINNQWEWLLHTKLDGVHFDEIPKNFDHIKKTLKKEHIIGLTCNNDLTGVKWADSYGLDYVSFCSVFPSPTANSCNLVTFDTIRKAGETTSLPIFLAGGITPENMDKLRGLDYSGIAVVSGIMGTDDPAAAVKDYQTKMNS